ncbi:MAG: DUF5682 family protein, partial [Saprospiraceae bacterium]|nr:DUF5682 family protein [Saprospiraceae bacterium]
GITVLYEAVQTIFTGGDTAQLRLIEKKLIVGQRMGDVPDTVPMIPLQKDIDKQAKSLRIPKKTEAYWLKANKERRKGGLDLRKEHDRKQSHFLHRLNLLGITWGEEGQDTGRELGTMNEYWKIAWKPEFVLDIIEAGMWGNTLEEASVCLALNSAKHTQNLAELTELLDKVLKSDISKAIHFLISQLRKLAAVTQDIALLMGAIPSLVNILRYGDVRGTDLDTIEPILNELVPRICVSLPSTCSAVDEDAAKVIFKQLLNTQRALALYNNRLLLTVWYDTLQQVSQSPQANTLLRGLANRILWDAQEVNAEDMEQRMYLALSSTQDLLKIAQWIEGFLHGSGLLLIHNHKLWRLLDQWVSQLSAESFQMLLPILRRTFAQFAIPEREKMLLLAKNNQPVAIAKDTVFDEERSLLVQPMLTLLFTQK